VKKILQWTLISVMTACGGGSSQTPPPKEPATVTAAQGPVMSAPQMTPPGGEKIDKTAMDVLRSMSDFLAKQPRITVHAEGSLEVVRENGEKVEFDHASQITVKRPNAFRSDRVGALATGTLYYDGKTFAFYRPDTHYYAIAPAPPTIDQAIDAAREKLGMETAAADLLYSNAFATMTDDVKGSVYVGIYELHGVRCHSLAFTGTETDWQIWIQEGPAPLPRKLVITTKTMKGAPEFRTELSQWDFPATMDESVFRFKPPADATRIDFLPRGGTQ
jgi:hypothetical protein